MRNLFLAGIILPLILDHIFTILGQPSWYWRDFSFAVEGSPFHFLLAFHPALFMIWGITYAGIVFILGRILPSRLVLVAGLLIYTGHAWGSASWIPELLKLASINFHYWYVTIGYFSILSLVLGLGIWKWHQGGFR